MLRAASRALSPAATATPTPRPTAEASSPTVTASASTEDRTWRRVAPSARSRPFSRVRWATVMEKVLKIMNAPTSRAVMANTRSRVVNWPIAFRVLDRSSLAACWPVTASRPAGSTARRLRTSWVCETPGRAANAMVAELTGRREQPLRDRGGEQHHGRADRAVGGTETGNARHLDPLRRAGGQHGGGVPDRKVTVPRALGVDRDLPGGLRGVACHQVVRVEGSDLAPVAAQYRRAVVWVAQRLPVLPDQPGVPEDLALVSGHALDRAQRGDEAGVHRGSLRAAVLDSGEGRLGPDDRVGPLVGGGVQPAEGLADGVGEHQRPGDQRHAEDDRHRGGGQAAPVREHALQ